MVWPAVLELLHVYTPLSSTCVREEGVRVQTVTVVCAAFFVIMLVVEGRHWRVAQQTELRVCRQGMASRRDCVCSFGPE